MDWPLFFIELPEIGLTKVNTFDKCTQNCLISHTTTERQIGYIFYQYKCCAKYSLELKNGEIPTKKKYILLSKEKNFKRDPSIL